MPLVREALADTRVVLIASPRQAGKSTLARMVLELEGGSRALNLDDEVQRAPDLLLAIKARVDRVRGPGQFLLTGSANVLQLPRIADAPPGRMAIIDLWPFSQGELTGRIERFVDRAFAGWQGTDVKTDLGKRHYLQRAVVGGFAEVVERPDARPRARWFDNSVRTMTQRDLPELSNIERADDLARLIRLLAARSGRLFKVEEVARDAGIPTTTATVCRLAAGSLSDQHRAGVGEQPHDPGHPRAESSNDRHWIDGTRDRGRRRGTVATGRRRRAAPGNLRRDGSAQVTRLVDATSNDSPFPHKRWYRGRSRSGEARWSHRRYRGKGGCNRTIDGLPRSAPLAGTRW